MARKQRAAERRADRGRSPRMGGHRWAARKRGGVVVLSEKPAPKVGDRVKIWRAPFAGQLGLYDGMQQHERVRSDA